MRMEAAPSNLDQTAVGWPRSVQRDSLSLADPYGYIQFLHPSLPTMCLLYLQLQTSGSKTVYFTCCEQARAIKLYLEERKGEDNILCLVLSLGCIK